MHILLRLRHLPLLLVFVLLQPAAAQESARLVLQPESKLWVEGTSNKNDWSVHAADVTGTIDVADGQINQVSVDVAAGAMKSNRSTIMDRLMHSALQAPEHPTISFVLDAPADGARGDAFSLDAPGRLTLAGETRDVTISVEGERLDDGSIRFTGSHPLTMSDYGITPPTAMFGSLRTADDVVVHFEIVGAPSPPSASQ